MPTLHISLTEHQSEIITAIENERGQNPSFGIAKLFSDFLNAEAEKQRDYNVWLAQETAKGMADIETGRVWPHEQVQAEVEAMFGFKK